MLVGCVTSSQDPVLTTTTTVPPAAGNVQRHAVCFGVTSVSPVPEYASWDGACPGCDLDAKGLNDLFNKNGVQSYCFLNSEATKFMFQHEIEVAADGLRRGDLLIVTLSGHGGQTPDLNGDETDGQDETIVLWDGTMVDDYIMSDIIQKLQAGIRVVLITDTCHSEGNFRAFVRATQRVLTFGKYGKKKGKALVKTAKKAETQDIELIQFAGCREASYSYGGNTGGTWTQSLLAKFKDGLTWRQWFDAAAKALPGNQVPVWAEYGKVTDGFKHGEALK